MLYSQSTQKPMVLYLRFALQFQSPPSQIQFVVICPNVIFWIFLLLVLEEPPPFPIPEFPLVLFFLNLSSKVLWYS
jgi:hypothetical protein